jgi:hypothetical protein
MDIGGDSKEHRLRTRGEIKISVAVAGGVETLTLETPQGGRLTIAGGSASVTVADSNGNTILLGPGGIEIKSSSRVTITASEMAINAGSLEVNSSSTKFSGVLNADSIIANSVTATVYTPGSGNIW